MTLDRRQLMALAAGMGAAMAWGARAAPSRMVRTVSAEAFPEGVASGDPDDASVVLWTRRPPAAGGAASRLTLELAEDESFQAVVATSQRPVSIEQDWTFRAVVGGLTPATEYWYRFTDDKGLGSRTGRTFTAPAAGDSRTARFAFVSCQNRPLGPLTAYRRLVAEDRARPAAERIGFVLHLGDFIYDEVWYPHDRPQFLGRTLTHDFRFPDGGMIGDVHYPVSLADYRALYSYYLRDPDLQDARARWPFVCVWDDHEFANDGWQSASPFAEAGLGAQSRKVAANRAWFEYIPSRAVHAGGEAGFSAPPVSDAPLHDLDDVGLSRESNNLAAIHSLKIYRSVTWGRHVELLLTDNRSYRSQPVMDGPAGAAFATPFAWFAAQDVVETLDAGRTAEAGSPPATLRFAGQDVANPRRGASPTSMLGGPQKAWLLERARTSRATWKVWGNSLGMLFRRTDLQNIPSADLRARWPSAGYAQYGTDDWCGFPAERAEILGQLKASGVTNFVSLAGDRHNFFAGLLSPHLPPGPFDPVAVEFVVGSISTPTSFEAAEHLVGPERASAPIYVRRPAGRPAQDTLSLSILHGVRTAYAYAATGDLATALTERNPEVSPHLAFCDMGGHGFGVASVTADAMEVEFTALPRPLAPSTEPMGDPVVYRVTHRVEAWGSSEIPRLTRVSLQGLAPLGN